jgi:hypothetical protein
MSDISLNEMLNRTEKKHQVLSEACALLMNMSPKEDFERGVIDLQEAIARLEDEMKFYQGEIEKWKVKVQ